MDLLITRLLHEARDGDHEALDRLFSAIYDELKVIARARRRAHGGGTLNTTALVHEAYVRLFGGAGVEVRDRGHFFALSSRAMRHVLVDHFRRGNAQKRASADGPVAPEDLAKEERGEVLLALDEALLRLEQLDPRLARVVEYRFFGGMTEAEIGRVLNVTDRTVRNDWRKARAWLTRELRNDAGDQEEGDERP